MATDTDQLTFPASLEGWWYTEPAIFAAEQRAIYGQRWVCVARSDEVARNRRLPGARGGRREPDPAPRRGG